MISPNENNPSVRVQYEKIKFKEKFSYGLGDVACNVVFALTTSLLVYFYTDVVNISVAIVGGIMMISRILNGIADIIMGIIIDRTNSKYGKARSWILWMTIPYGISAVLLFTVPEVGQWAKAIYIFIVYNITTTIIYTALNLPYAVLATVMTRDTNQRAVINLYRMSMASVSNMIITSITLPLIDLLGGNKKAWVCVSSIYALVSVILLLICFFNCKERVHTQPKLEDSKNLSIFTGLKLTFTNKYFIILFAMTIFLAFHESVTGICSAYYAEYVLGNINHLKILTIFESVPQIVTIFSLAFFITRYGKRNIALFGSLLSIIGMCFLAIAPENLNYAAVASSLRGIGKGCLRGVKYSMLADVIEYGHWKTGVRIQGLLVTSTTAGQKFGNGAVSALVCGLLEWAGYNGAKAVQADTAVDMVNKIYIFGNIGAWSLIVISLLFYNLDKLYPYIIEKLQVRESVGITCNLEQ